MCRKGLSFHCIWFYFHFDKYRAKYMQNTRFSIPSLLLTIIGNQPYCRTLQRLFSVFSCFDRKSNRWFGRKSLSASNGSFRSRIFRRSCTIIWRASAVCPRCWCNSCRSRWKTFQSLYFSWRYHHRFGVENSYKIDFSSTQCHKLVQKVCSKYRSSVGTNETINSYGLQTD